MQHVKNESEKWAPEGMQTQQNAPGSKQYHSNRLLWKRDSANSVKTLTLEKVALINIYHKKNQFLYAVPNLIYRQQMWAIHACQSLLLGVIGAWVWSWVCFFLSKFLYIVFFCFLLCGKSKKQLVLHIFIRKFPCNNSHWVYWLNKGLYQAANLVSVLTESLKSFLTT